jgi:beta-phosphoglucomutase-like phosphatase (HAD superfamily)
VVDTAIFDVDGTLVDTNYQHALAFYRAFRRYDITLPMWRLHRATGMSTRSSPTSPATRSSGGTARRCARHRSRSSTR